MKYCNKAHINYYVNSKEVMTRRLPYFEHGRDGQVIKQIMSGILQSGPKTTGKKTSLEYIGHSATCAIYVGSKIQRIGRQRTTSVTP